MKCLYVPDVDCARSPSDVNCPECETMKTAMGDTPAGLKFDTNKPRWDLLPLSLVEETVKVITFGAKKYGPNNWQRVDNGIDRYYAALMRHIVAYKNGELYDQESKLSHLAHAMCNLIFLSELQEWPK